MPRRVGGERGGVRARSGTAFAALLCVVLLSGILHGEFFPSVACAADEFSDFASVAQCNPATNAATALVWGFVGGFAERLVPNVLDRFIGDKEP